MSTTELKEDPSDKRRLYQGVQCPACHKVHTVDPFTGELVSDEADEYDQSAQPF
jgi:hypothetical protein